MGRKTHRFIDKKHDSVHTFKVVQRSQKDPLVADETAPQGVLVDTQCSDSHKEELHKYGVYFDDDYDYLQHLRGVKEAVDWEDGDVEVYTIRNEDPKLTQDTHKGVGLLLPSSAFESYVEEPIGLLNKAAPITGPRPELDPDVVVKLCDGDLEEGEVYDPDDASGLPDNFISLLNSENDIEAFVEKDEYEDIQQWLGNTQSCESMPSLEGSYKEQSFFYTNDIIKNKESYSDEAQSDSEDSSSSSKDRDVGIDDLFLSDDERDEVRSLSSPSFKRGTKSDVRSKTSASSATVPRSELLMTLDERFEWLYNEEYTDDQIGSLDGVVIEGPFDVDAEVFQQAVRATKQQFEKNNFMDIKGEDKDRTVQWVKQNMKFRNDMQGESEETVTVEVKTKPKYDCESILSTYSNTRNRPHLVDDSYLYNKKKSKLTRKAVREHNKDEEIKDFEENEVETLTLASCLSAISFRPKGETPEDRRERKSALKELRRERRKEKKLNQLAFKEELKKQRKVGLHKPRSRIVPVL